MSSGEERDREADWYAQHCANCKRAWGDVRQCCTISSSPYVTTHCTECCDGQLHASEQHDSDESESDVYHG